jgi:putative PIN family toxin of toxin-antitoxin system
MWVSYATHADGPRSHAIQRAIRHRVRLFASEFILAEVERVLTEKLGFSRRFARLTVNSLRRLCTVVQLPQVIEQNVAADPNDDPIVQTALTGKADCVVTADKALLKLAKVRDVEIISLDDWMSRLPPDG